jgi:uncharacterized coiled-coil protein SlyX
MPRKKIELWFKAESDAIAAIAVGRASQNWEILATEIERLLEARTQRANAAHNGKKVQLVRSTEEAEAMKGGGRYLVQPPLVARDAALLDNALKSSGVSSVVACREPVTSLGMCPIVALGSGVTVRIQVKEPDNAQKPTCAWFDAAIEELGNHVIEQLNATATEQRQLDYLLAHLSAIPTHVATYRAAIERCNTLAHQSV